MEEVVYDMPIKEVAGILDKSDRQVRRYVKDRRLRATPARIDGHIKLMFNREQVEEFKGRLDSGYFGKSGREIIVDAQLVGDGDEGSQPEPGVAGMEIDQPGPVKYVIDALRDQLKDLHKENRELHYQLEQRSGQVGFLQGRVETLEEERKMLMPAQTSERKPWYRWIFG